MQLDACVGAIHQQAKKMAMSNWEEMGKYSGMAVPVVNLITH